MIPMNRVSLSLYINRGRKPHLYLKQLVCRELSLIVRRNGVKATRHLEESAILPHSEYMILEGL